MGLEVKGFNLKSTKFKVIVAGTRDFQDYNFLCEKLDFLLSKKTEVEIVSGTTNSADILGERYAANKHYPIAYYPLERQRFGKMAEPIRNKAMAEYADVLVTFWDGVSPGTRNLIENTKLLNKPVRIYYFGNRCIAAAVAMAKRAGFDLDLEK